MNLLWAAEERISEAEMELAELKKENTSLEKQFERVRPVEDFPDET